ncbi:MAG: hypothetical protein C4519_22250 [Desulfobacteraceae bacterium]|nr:MAG: hypothetical protein C4519_22250 [Desulfobacteraceae bacterium]
MKQWKCTVCGYIHAGNEPPEKCPVCAADRSKFVPIEEVAEKTNETQPSRPRPKATPNPNQDPTKQENRSQPVWQRIAASTIGQKLTRYHGHPIAVHIPNGVLPLAVLFTLLAAIFKSESLAIAAQYNVGFVALSMPIVIATGLIDWINSFKARMTRVFRIKMICAGIVTVVSIILTFWGIARPDIYNSPLAQSWFFLLLHITNLVAATIAGLYGGKLVFRK